MKRKRTANPKDHQRRPPLVNVWPDDCECSARDRCICAQGCKPVRHKIKCAVVSRRGPCDCGAVKPETCLSPARVKSVMDARRVVMNTTPPWPPMPWPPCGVSVGKWNAERVYGGKLQDQINQLAGIRNAIYLHPDDFHIGQVVYWMRDRKVRSGVVVAIRNDDYQPALVRSAGHPKRYHYKPTIYAYCDPDGNKPCVCELPIGRRTACQQQKACPIRSGDATEADLTGPVKLMQGHSPAALAGLAGHVALYGREFVGGDAPNRQLEVYALGAFHNAKVLPNCAIQGSLMGPNEYATGTLVERGVKIMRSALAEYEVRNGGIYTRRFNVRLAKFALNSVPLQEALKAIFNAAHADETAAEKARELPVGAQIKARQAAERKAHGGWYTCQCGQWVNDKTCPCSVCKPKRKPRKKK